MATHEYDNVRRALSQAESYYETKLVEMAKTQRVLMQDRDEFEALYNIALEYFAQANCCDEAEAEALIRSKYTAERRAAS